MGTDLQDQTKWRCLIRRGAGDYEAKRISEAEQKRAQRKARAKILPTELSSSDLSCSICNRQFRATIGLISHLRTHKHINNNTSHSWLGLLIVSNDRRTIKNTIPMSVKQIPIPFLYLFIRIKSWKWLNTFSDWSLPSFQGSGGDQDAQARASLSPGASCPGQGILPHAPACLKKDR